MTTRVLDIMLPVRDDGKGDAVLGHAAIMAKRYGAHVRVVHCRAKAEDMMPYGVVIPKVVRRQIEAAAKANADLNEVQMRAAFMKLANDLGLADAPPEWGRPTGEVIEFEGKQADAVRQYGRLSDLVCVPQPDKAAKLGINTLKSALYTTGRPVMICPDRATPNEALGNHVAIGWNGSLEATRAIGLARGILESAERVTILTSGTELPGAGADDLRVRLERFGVLTDVRRFKAKGVVGRSLLSEAEASGADVLLMGAYHESYERETIFGGNTQVVIDEANFPVILVH